MRLTRYETDAKCCGIEGTAQTNGWIDKTATLPAHYTFYTILWRMPFDFHNVYVRSANEWQQPTAFVANAIFFNLISLPLEYSSSSGWRKPAYSNATQHSHIWTYNVYTFDAKWKRSKYYRTSIIIIMNLSLNKKMNTNTPYYATNSSGVGRFSDPIFWMTLSWQQFFAHFCYHGNST